MLGVNYAAELQIKNAPEKLYDALTTQEGLEKWWTQQTELYPRVGGIGTFHFGNGEYIVMKITKMLPSKEVVWKCVEQNFVISGSDRTDEWVGTTVKISINENKDQTTTLSFVHNGLSHDLLCYETSKDGWDFYLNSLKDYLETGKGKPFKLNA